MYQICWEQLVSDREFYAYFHSLTLKDGNIKHHYRMAGQCLEQAFIPAR
jgi:hypothetical protein